MSRWQTEFDNHAFQSTWKTLVEKTSSATVDDKTVITSTEELARLQKVITFLKQLISSVDVELIPLSTWDSFNQQATNCLNEITAYESDRNIVRIKTANQFADNLLSYIKPYEIPAQSVEETLQAAFKAYAATIESYAKRFDSAAQQSFDNIVVLEKNSIKATEDISKLRSDIEGYKDKLLGDEESSISKQIDVTYAEFIEKRNELVDYYEETFVDEENSTSIKTTIQSIQKDIEENQNTVETLTNEVQKKISAINTFSTKVFGEPKEGDEADKESLTFKLDDLMGKLTNFEVAQKRKYSELNKEIEGLLPGATNAALASAYGSMKKTFKDPILHNTYLFFGALGSILALTLLLYFGDAISYVGGIFTYKQTLPSERELLVSVVYKLPIFVPLIWLAYYASKRRSEYQRLQQEYAHKESLAKSYDSYRRQISELGTGEDIKHLQAALISRAVDVISYNASSTLDGKHGDKMPIHELIEAIKETKLNTSSNG